jgi:hypothetical protein
MNLNDSDSADVNLMITLDGTNIVPCLLRIVNEILAWTVHQSTRKLRIQLNMSTRKLNYTKNLFLHVEWQLYTAMPDGQSCTSNFSKLTSLLMDRNDAQPLVICTQVYNGINVIANRIFHYY